MLSNLLGAVTIGDSQKPATKHSPWTDIKSSAPTPSSSSKAVSADGPRAIHAKSAKPSPWGAALNASPAASCQVTAALAAPNQVVTGVSSSNQAPQGAIGDKVDLACTSSLSDGVHAAVRGDGIPSLTISKPECHTTSHKSNIGSDSSSVRICDQLW